MLTELCEYLKNWDFHKRAVIHSGSFTIENGVLLGIDTIAQDGQYFRIVGSVFNDGVYKNPVKKGELSDETFDGAVWAMAVPKEVVKLAEDIAEWQAKYGGVNSAAMSPFQSESFKGYSYSKGGTSRSGSQEGAGAPSWQDVFAARLNKWRKI